MGSTLDLARYDQWTNCLLMDGLGETTISTPSIRTRNPSKPAPKIDAACSKPALLNRVDGHACISEHPGPVQPFPYFPTSFVGVTLGS